MSQSTIASDLIVQGTIVPRGISLPSGCVTDANIAVAAGIESNKVQQQYSDTYRQSSSVNSSTDQSVMHIVYGTSGTILQYGCGFTVAPTAGASVTYDLLNNGSSVLASAVTLTGGSAYALSYGSVLLPSLTSGNVLEAKVTVPTGSVKGVFAHLVLNETPN